MAGRRGYFRIKNQNAEQVKGMILEFENRYHPYQTYWDCEALPVGSDRVMLQLIDRGYEPPSGKGRSDAPELALDLQQSGEDVLGSWRFQWKPWKRKISWLTLALLLISRFFVLLGFDGDFRILYAAIWLFAATLYGGWLLQNFHHDRLTLDTFRQLLDINFRGIVFAGDPREL